MTNNSQDISHARKVQKAGEQRDRTKANLSSREIWRVQTVGGRNVSHVYLWQPPQSSF